MLRVRAFTVLWFGVCVLGSTAGAAAVHEFELANGLKLIVKEDHRAPVVVSQVWYRVGSSFEPPGLTGISHLLEHMMFKGTARHPPGEFSRIIADHGGEENAFTSRDYTAYYQELGSDRLEVALELEADRMRQLTLPEEEFAKERQVVKEERRLRTEDDPQALAAERFFAVAYLTSPYRQPVIGWMDDLDHLTRTDLEGWYQTWYAPNNAVVVVVGDVDPQQVRAQVQRHFGGLAPSRLPQRKPIREIEPSGARRIVVKAPAKLPYLLMGYQVPVVSTTQEPWEPYALDVLADVLDGGDSARLTRDLIRGKEVASQLAADYQMYTGRSGLLQFEGIPNTGHDATELEVALRAQVERLREAPISATELQRVKSQAIADEVFARDSLFYQGLLMGRLEAVGLPWKRMDEYVERIQAVTAEQVQEVARRYLVDDRLTVAVLEPLPLGKPTERPPAAGRMEQDVR